MGKRRRHHDEAGRFSRTGRVVEQGAAGQTDLEPVRRASRRFAAAHQGLCEALADRRAAGATVVELAEATGLSVPTVRKYAKKGGNHA